MTRIALYQANTGIDPARNADQLTDAARQAAAGGAAMLFTPEMSGLLDRDRARAARHIAEEADCATLRAMQAAARDLGLWIALGSLAIRNPDGTLANRSFVIDAAGRVVARYDKIHMFDVALGNGDDWRESAAYRAGTEVVTVPDTPVGRLGLTVCYDLRFPALFDALGRAQCDAIAIPAAFTVTTGIAHWHILQRARAIEASAFVIAAAQAGRHEDGRETFGHSLVVDPWGEVLLDMGRGGRGVGFCEIDPARIAEVRERLPSLANRRPIAT